LDTDLVQFEANHSIYSVSPYPPLAFDAVMALGIAGCRARNDYFSGEELFDEFTSVEFDGASGSVSIDARTGSRYYNSTAYVIYNVVATTPDEDGDVSFTMSVAAEYYRGKKSAHVSWHQAEGVKYNYSDMTFDPPLSLPPVDAERDSVNISVYGIIISLACVVMLSSLLFAVWAWRNRTNHVVRASQPEFLIVICVGVFLMASTAITIAAESPPFSFKFADVSCMLTWWFFCTGFGLAFSALFAKTWRVNKVSFDFS
jgi:hypothetical protein